MSKTKARILLTLVFFMFVDPEAWFQDDELEEPAAVELATSE